MEHPLQAGAADITPPDAPAIHKPDSPCTLIIACRVAGRCFLLRCPAVLCVQGRGWAQGSALQHTYARAEGELDCWIGTWCSKPSGAEQVGGHCGRWEQGSVVQAQLSMLKEEHADTEPASP